MQSSNRDSEAFLLYIFVFQRKLKIRVHVFVNETHLDQMLVSQVYRCMSGNDYFAKKGGEGSTQREVEENWNSCWLTWVLSRSLFFFYSLSVEEEEEDEEMMEAKPGPESEQQDEDDNKETKEGTKDGRMAEE